MVTPSRDAAYRSIHVSDVSHGSQSVNINTGKTELLWWLTLPVFIFKKQKQKDKIFPT